VYRVTQRLIVHRVPYSSTEWAKKMAPFIVRLITSPNINQFSQFFHCQNQETICNETVTTDSTTPQVCRYARSWNIRWCTAMPLTGCVINVDRAWHVAPKQPRLKSSWLCCLGCPSTDGLLMLTIHDSQPAKGSHCHWVGQSAAAFGWSRHLSEASPASMRCPVARRTHWKFHVKTEKMWF